MKKFLQVSRGVLGLAVLAAGGCQRAAAPAAVVTPAAVVRLVPVELSELSPPVRVPGVLSRKTEADLAFKIGGVIAEVAVRAGDRVERGQVVARLRLDEIEAQLAQAQSAADKARRDLARVEKLRAGRVATEENLQDAHTAVTVAEANLRIAEFNRRYAEIVAPANGRVLRRLAEPGELTAAGRAIVALASEEDGWLVRAGLAERDVGTIAAGAAAQVKFGDERWRPAQVARISEANEAATRTTPVEIALAAAPEGARSGSIVAVEIERKHRPARPLVPATALVEGGGDRASVFLVDEAAGVAHRTPVTVEQIDGEQAWLRTMLPAGARIVASGAEFLRDGAKVEAAK